jgi:regulation of enolase protein 1 (concanavalin A-like superfamily)
MKKALGSQLLTKIVMIFGIIVISASSFAAPKAPALMQKKDLVFQTSVEFTPVSIAPGFTSAEPYSQVWNANGSTYFVWVDANYRAWVAQIKNGVLTQQPVDSNVDYKVQADGHHRFSIGVDTDGYVHVTGDMHHYSTFTDSVITPYPVRYQHQSILYWKSNAPNDISKGFTFAGGVNTQTTIPGGGWMMGRFFSDNNGVLYYSSMVHAYEASNNSGQMAVGLYRYDTAQKGWTAIGAKAPATQPNMVNVFPVFYWEFAGLGTGQWFQNYQGRFQFDSTNRLHFIVSANTNNNAYGANRLLYAVSADDGNTWKKANGVGIAGLPLRGIDGQPNTADVVAELNVSPGFTASPGIVVDKLGNVAVSANGVWYQFNGSKWDGTSKQNIPNYPSASFGSRMPDNSIIYQMPSLGKLLYSDDLNHSPIGYDLQMYGGLACVDENGLRNTGIVRSVGTSGDQKSQVFLKTQVMHAPLPAGWEGKNITPLSPPYLGSSGYQSGVFTLNGYGSGLGNANDSFYFVSKKMTGDGVITARVTSLTLSTPGQGYGDAGVMMRETLAPGSKNAFMVIAPGASNKGAVFGVRDKASSFGWTTNQAALNKTPYWVRLVRQGNLFTGYASPDGNQWTVISSVTIPMNAEIYVGLATASLANGYYNAVATLDNVSSPG